MTLGAGAGARGRSADPVSKRKFTSHAFQLPARPSAKPSVGQLCLQLQYRRSGEWVYI